MTSTCKGSITDGMRIGVWIRMASHGRMGSLMVVRRWNIRCVVVQRCMVMAATVTILLTRTNLIRRSLRWIVRCGRLAWLKLGRRLSLGAFSVFHTGVGIVNTSLSSRSVRHTILSLWLATWSSFWTRQACRGATVLLLLAFSDDIWAKICVLKILASMKLDTTSRLLL